MAEPAPDSADFLARLRQKWQEIPAGAADRIHSRKLCSMSDRELHEFWREETRFARQEGFPIRGWYHTLYRDGFRGRRLLDVGSGFGLDALTFAAAGAEVTCLDVAPTNLELIQRLAALLGLAVTTVVLDSLDTLLSLRGPFDVIWAIGSLHHAPFELASLEAARLLGHLPAGGRWIELAYPRRRWLREGSLPFAQWGEKTDGSGTPWAEWYDLEKLRARLAPVRFDTVLDCNIHDDDFHWFDLCRC